MFRIFKGEKPDVTPAQLIALLIAGVPVTAKLLAAFSVYTLTAVQQAALTDTLTWAGIVAGALFFSDAGIRAARNQAAARRDSAVLLTQSTAGPALVTAANSLEKATTVLETTNTALEKIAKPRQTFLASPPYEHGAAGSNTNVLSEFKSSGPGWEGTPPAAAAASAPGQPPDLTPVEPKATPAEGPVADADVAEDGTKLVDDETEFASPPPPIGRPADPDAR